MNSRDQTPSLPAEVIPADLGEGVCAFFTTRLGGVSATPYDSLNLGGAVGDEAAAVRRNRELVDELVGAPVRFATQVHGKAVLAPGCADGQADALLATDDGVGVLVADCVPVLLRGPGMVAAVHAGRKGLLGGVIEATLEAMAQRGQSATHAVIGPAICGSCYEVPAEMRDQAARDRPAVASTTSWGTPGLDLPAGAHDILTTAGVQTTALNMCTLEDHRFFSYRRDGRTGRFAAVIALRHAAVA